MLPGTFCHRLYPVLRQLLIFVENRLFIIVLSATRQVEGGIWGIRPRGRFIWIVVCWGMKVLSWNGSELSEFFEMWKMNLLNFFFELFCLKWVQKHLNVGEQPVGSMRWAGDFFEMRRRGVDLCCGENDKKVRCLFCVELFFILFFCWFFFFEKCHLNGCGWIGIFEIYRLH